MKQELPRISDQVYKNDILNVLEKTYSIIGPHWMNYQVEWMNGVYSAFKDHEKFLIIIYLTKKTLDFYSRNLIKLNYDQFYLKDTFEIDKFNIIEISNKAIASSGNYRHFKVDEETGMKYAHTINPKTGVPLQTNLLGVTIMTESCMEADALATAFMVMGLETSKQYLKNHPEIDALFIYSNSKGEWLQYQTEGFENVSVYQSM